MPSIEKDGTRSPQYDTAEPHTINKPYADDGNLQRFGPESERASDLCVCAGVRVRECEEVSVCA